SVQNVVFRDDQYLPVQGQYASTWRSDVARAGAGVLLEHSVHDLDLLDWLMGPIVRISAATAFHHGIEGIDDAASCLATGADGAQAVLATTWHDMLHRPSQRRVEVLCTRRAIVLEHDWVGPVHWEDAGGGGGSIEGDELLAAVRRVSDLRTN